MKVAKWGNSLAVRLPAEVVRAMELKENDNIDLHVQGARSMGVGKSPSGKQLLMRLRRLRGRLPEGFRFDRWPDVVLEFEGVKGAQPFESHRKRLRAPERDPLA